MKRNRYQKRRAELRKVRAVLSDIENVSDKELRSIDVKIFYGAEHRCIEEIINRAVQYLERKDQSNESELLDWFISKADAFQKRFGRDLDLQEEP